MKRFIVCLLHLLSAVHGYKGSAFDSKNSGWLIEVDTFQSDNVTLSCPFNRRVFCQWKRNQRIIETGGRYKYVTGEGDNVDDCSLRLTSIKNIDFTQWICEAYDKPDKTKQPDFTMVFRISSDVHDSSSIQPVNLNRRCSTFGEQTYSKQLVLTTAYEESNGLLTCLFNTPVDRCTWKYVDDTIKLNSCYNVDTNNCSTPTFFRSFNTKPITCEGKKEIIVKTVENGSTTKLPCFASSKVNCIWKRNNDDVAIDGRFEYDVNDGLNVQDCSIRIFNTSTIDTGFWMCQYIDNYVVKRNAKTSNVLGGYELQVQELVNK